MGAPSWADRYCKGRVQVVTSWGRGLRRSRINGIDSENQVKPKVSSFIEGMDRPLISPPGTQERCQSGMLCCLSLSLVQVIVTSAVSRPCSRLLVDSQGSYPCTCETGPEPPVSLLLQGRREAQCLRPLDVLGADLGLNPSTYMAAL